MRHNLREPPIACPSIVPSRSVLSCLLAALLSFSAGAADPSLGSFRDWSTMRFGDGDDLACMAFTQPKKSEGDYTKRGDAFVFITHRPAAGERDRISLDTGYTYQPGSEVDLSVDDLHLRLRTRGSTAWVDDDADTQRLVKAMRAGRELVVKGTSSRGTATVDHYSLYGFSAAHQAIGKACR